MKIAVNEPAITQQETRCFALGNWRETKRQNRACWEWPLFLQHAPFHRPSRDSVGGANPIAWAWMANSACLHDCIPPDSPATPPSRSTDDEHQAPWLRLVRSQGVFYWCLLVQCDSQILSDFLRVVVRLRSGARDDMSFHFWFGPLQSGGRRLSPDTKG